MIKQDYRPFVYNSRFYNEGFFTEVPITAGIIKRGLNKWDIFFCYTVMVRRPYRINIV